jgi:hypothetical protein
MNVKFPKAMIYSVIFALIFTAVLGLLNYYNIHIGDPVVVKPMNETGLPW